LLGRTITFTKEDVGNTANAKLRRIKMLVNLTPHELNITINNYSNSTVAACREAFSNLKPKTGSKFELKDATQILLEEESWKAEESTILSFQFDGKSWLDSCGNEWSSKDVDWQIWNLIDGLDMKRQDWLQHC
jgi:hypothetical protein